MIPLRDENPSESIPVVTYLLIAANVAVFVLQTITLLAYGQEGATYLVFAAGCVPHELTTLQDLGPHNVVPVVLTPLSSMFMHGGILHLVGNMLFLWIFGDNVEDFMGHGRFLAFYLGTGLAAVAAHVASAPHSDVPVVGASGAISGVLGAYVLLYPRARVLTVIPIFIFIQLVYLPAYMFIGIWFLLQVLESRMEGQLGGGGVAFLAHIGGFLAGLIMVPLFERKRRRRRIDTYWE